MSKKRIEVVERIKTAQLIDHTVAETSKGVGKAILYRWGPRIFLSGVGFGVLLALVGVLVVKWL